MALPATISTNESGDEKQHQILVTRDEFDAIKQDCQSLYRTNDRLKFSNFLAHLLRYDTPKGLRLATAEMTIQGYDNGGDILRMASNILKLEQARQFVHRNSVNDSSEKSSYNKELQILTMSLDEFIAHPASSTLEFFDFVLGDDTNDNFRRRKEEVARNYEKHYYEKMKTGEKHITHDKARNNDREQLIQYLRNDRVFGPPLHKIELLVESALASRRHEEGMPIL